MVTRRSHLTWTSSLMSLELCTSKSAKRKRDRQGLNTKFWGEEREMTELSLTIRERKHKTNREKEIMKET